MKRIFILLFALAVLCTGCAEKPAEPGKPSGTEQAGEEIPETFSEAGIPQGLAGSWVSASSGSLGYTENITLEEDGSISVELYEDGDFRQRISGTYEVRGSVIYYSITEGTSPYEGTFRFRLDGRELFLDDSDGEAHYLRNS